MMDGIISEKGIELCAVFDIVQRLADELNARAQFKWNSSNLERRPEWFDKYQITPDTWLVLRLIYLARDEYFGKANTYTADWPEGKEEYAHIFPMQYTLDGMESSDFTCMARKEYDKKVLDGFDKEKFFDEIANPLAALNKAIAALRYECVYGRLKCWVFRYEAEDGYISQWPVKDGELTAYRNAMKWASENWLSTKSGEDGTDMIKASFKVMGAGIKKAGAKNGKKCWEIAIPYVFQSRHRDTCVYINRNPPWTEIRKNNMVKYCFYRSPEGYERPGLITLEREPLHVGEDQPVKELGWGSFTEKKIMLDDHTEKEDGKKWYCSSVIFPEYEDNLGMACDVRYMKHDRAKEIIANGGTVPGHAG